MWIKNSKDIYTWWAYRCACRCFQIHKVKKKKKKKEWERKRELFVFLIRLLIRHRIHALKCYNRVGLVAAWPEDSSAGSPGDAGASAYDIREQLVHPSWLITPAGLLPLHPENESRWWTRVRVPSGVALTLLWGREYSSCRLEDLLFTPVVDNWPPVTEHGDKQIGAFALNFVIVRTYV